MTQFLLEKGNNTLGGVSLVVDKFGDEARNEKLEAVAAELKLALVQIDKLDCPVVAAHLSRVIDLLDSERCGT